jgi:hypothetical protein
MIQPFVQELWHFVFSVLAPWWPNQESDWTEVWYVSLYSYLLGHAQSFGLIAPVVTKRALLTDDGRHVIVGSPHSGEPKSLGNNQCTSTPLRLQTISYPKHCLVLRLSAP